VPRVIIAARIDVAGNQIDLALKALKKAHGEGRHLPGNEAPCVLREAVGEAKAQASSGAETTTESAEARERFRIRAGTAKDARLTRSPGTVSVKDRLRALEASFDAHLTKPVALRSSVG
jgi:hypothetical protein